MEEALDNNRCHICPLTEDNAPRTPVEITPWMNLQCGHRIHTNCFLEKLYNDDISPIRFSCPICQEHALTNHMITWLQANDFQNATRAETLWKENAEFRQDIQNLSKLQRQKSAIIHQHKRECRNIKREWNETIHPSLEFIRLKRKEFRKRLQSLPSRTNAIRAINAIIATRGNIVRKYPTFNWYDFLQLRRIPGVPKLKKYPRHGRWLLFSAENLFRGRT